MHKTALEAVCSLENDFAVIQRLSLNSRFFASNVIYAILWSSGLSDSVIVQTVAERS